MPIDLLAAFENDPPPQDFIWQGFLAGTVGALVAPGATGKSFWALEAAMAIACGDDDGDLLNLKPQRGGRVVYLAGEDPVDEVIRRCHEMGKHLNKKARAAIAQNLTLEPIMGRRLNVMDEKHLLRLIEFCANSRLIVLDTLSRIHGLDENSNGDMGRLISTLEHVAAATGAAVLYLHHVSKSSARDGQVDQQHASRGASVLVDNPRWCGYVSRMTKDQSIRLSDRPYDKRPVGHERRGFFIRFGESKQNYGPDVSEQWYERRQGGVLMPVDLTTVVSSEVAGKKVTPFKKGVIDEEW